MKNNMLKPLAFDGMHVFSQAIDHMKSASESRDSLKTRHQTNSSDCSLTETQSSPNNLEQQQHGDECGDKVTSEPGNNMPDDVETKVSKSIQSMESRIFTFINKRIEEAEWRINRKLDRILLLLNQGNDGHDDKIKHHVDAKLSIDSIGLD